MFHISSCSWLSSKAFYLLLILSNDQLPAVATSSIRLSIAAHTILPIRYWQSSQIQQGTHTFERNRIPKPQWSTVFEIREKPFKGGPLHSILYTSKIHSGTKERDWGAMSWLVNGLGAHRQRSPKPWRLPATRIQRCRIQTSWQARRWRRGWSYSRRSRQPQAPSE